MKKASYVVFFVLLTSIWGLMAGAESNAGAGTQDQAIQPQTSIDADEVVTPQAGIPWEEKVKMWREIRKRGAASRNALLAEAEKERKKKAPKPKTVKSPLDL